MELEQFLLHPKLKSEYVLLFDLDGTLLETNLCNNCAYEYALYKVFGNQFNSALSHLARITRKDIATLDIGPKEMKQIIQLKQRSFKKNIPNYTVPFITFDVLLRFYGNNGCYLITTADEARALNLIQFYELKQYFAEILFVDSNDKYCNIASRLNIDISKIILFEDNVDAIKNAQKNGLNNVVEINSDTLKEYKIITNKFLAQDTLAFFHLYYRGYQHPLNPNFINDLKNQFDNFPYNQLQNALKELTRYLQSGISNIYYLLGQKELIVISIPRAKSESYYSENQKLFRYGISYTVKYLHDKMKLRLVDGTQFIKRHTNTKTTHLASSNVVNDGDMPYVGITRNTCNISDDVIGKDVLLIDDIYTRDVNIDEDAIQALYDKGVHSVIFYSICKTFKYK